MVALATALATGLGALPFVFTSRADRAWLGTANSLAAGLMLGASAGLLYEGARYNAERTALGALAGGIFASPKRGGAPRRGPTDGCCVNYYAEGSGCGATLFGLRFPNSRRAGSPPLRVPPAARMPKPIPESRRAMPTTIAKSEIDSAM